MEGKNKKNRPVSWFWRWFLNNQVVTALLVVLLILLIVFLFTKVSYLFAPIWQFFSNRRTTYYSGRHLVLLDESGS